MHSVHVNDRVISVFICVIMNRDYCQERAKMLCLVVGLKLKCINVDVAIVMEIEIHCAFLF